MSNDKTLADVQPGGRVRLGDQAERARFEDWARDFYHLQCMGDTYRSAITTNAWQAWQAALSAQPSPGGQDALQLANEWRHVFNGNGHDMAGANKNTMRRFIEAIDALAARQPVGEHMRSDLSGYAVTASQVRRGYDVECDRCGKFCDEGPGPCQPVGEPVAWLIDWPGEPDLGHYFAEEPVQGGRSRPLYAAPAQAVDLGQFRDVVADWRERCCRAADKDTILNMAKADRLMALIDSHQNRRHVEVIR